MNNEYMGLDGFIWFTGVVEDRNDPDKLGRVRVRCLGYHTEDKKLIPNNNKASNIKKPTKPPIQLIEKPKNLNKNFKSNDDL